VKIDDNAAKLAKNPLGIFALFIILTYGMASLLFGYVNNNISEAQKWVFVVFIVSFPVLVLVIFSILVIKYHSHLYNPAEFKDETTFLGINKSKEIGKKKEKEREIEVEEIVETEKSSDTEYSKNDKTENKKIMSQYIKAETLVLNRLAKEKDAVILRDISINNDRDIEFDGLLENDKTLIFVEVKYLRRNFVSFSVIENVAYRAKRVLDIVKNNTNINKKVAFILVFVIDSADTDLKRLQTKLNEYKKILSLPSFDILLYRIDELEQ
jgi:hypothetical protein